jgi:sporulation protein YlmC with PRC-barrel domain
MNTKDLLGKKIIDKEAKDLAKLAEIDVNVKTFKISKIYGSIGNPLSKKYYDIPADIILAVGDYIQVSETKEELESKLLEKIPASEEKNVKINNLIGKTVLDFEGNVAGKVSNVDLDLEKYEITNINIAGPSSSFVKPKKDNIINKEDITSIGDYILINKVLTEAEEEEEEKEESSEKESFNVDIN